MTSPTPTNIQQVLSNAQTLQTQQLQSVQSSAALNIHNIQALTELYYVGTGNQVMNSALVSLDQALQVTQQALNLLAVLQNLHNDVTVNSGGAFNFPLAASYATVTLTNFFSVSSNNVPVLVSGVSVATVAESVEITSADYPTMTVLSSYTVEYQSLTTYTTIDIDSVGSGTDASIDVYTQNSLLVIATYYTTIQSEFTSFPQISQISGTEFSTALSTIISNVSYQSSLETITTYGEVGIDSVYTSYQTSLESITTFNGVTTEGITSVSGQDLFIGNTIGNTNRGTVEVGSYLGSTIFPTSIPGFIPPTGASAYYIVGTYEYPFPGWTTTGTGNQQVLMGISSSEVVDFETSFPTFVITTMIFSSITYSNTTQLASITSNFINAIADSASTTAAALYTTGVYFSYSAGSVESFSTFSANWTGADGNTYASIYQEAASAFFGQPIDPIFAVTVNGTTIPIVSALQPEYISVASQLMSTKAQISALIASLSAISAPGDSTTLLTQLKAVYTQLPQDNFTSIQAWMEDGYTGNTATTTATAGNIQNTITTAITAAESLNDSQKESVRNYMFIFQEYYQSASGILSTLTQIIQDMAKNIA